MKQCALLLYDGVTALDAIGLYEVLSGLPDVSVCFVAETAGPQRTDTRALALIADYALRDVPSPDMLLIPGGNTGTLAASRNEQILDWVRAAHTSSLWTTSVCTGAWILGAAGLLHDLYGAIYVPERYVQDGKILTAAGVSAGIDMALFLASQLTDVQTAQAIQIALEYDPHPPFDTGSPRKATPFLLEISREKPCAALCSARGFS